MTTTSPDGKMTGIPAGVVGATGLVGSQILQTLLTYPRFSSITSYTRKPITTIDPSSRLHPTIDPTSTNWPTSFVSGPEIFFSALGTTRAAAGGIDNQRKIDLDLNVEMAKAAKAAGVRVYVLISSQSANSKSYNAYSKMKGELEDAVGKMGFEKAVVLRPGLIVGERTESRPAEAVIRAIAKGFGAVSRVLKDPWAQDADVIGRAAVAAGLLALDGKTPIGGDGVWVVGMADIVRLGRTEWKET